MCGHPLACGVLPQREAHARIKLLEMLDGIAGGGGGDGCSPHDVPVFSHDPCSVGALQARSGDPAVAAVRRLMRDGRGCDADARPVAILCNDGHECVYPAMRTERARKVSTRCARRSSPAVVSATSSPGRICATSFACSRSGPSTASSSLRPCVERDAERERFGASLTPTRSTASHSTPAAEVRRQSAL